MMFVSDNIVIDKNIVPLSRSPKTFFTGLPPRTPPKWQSVGRQPTPDRSFSPITTPSDPRGTITCYYAAYSRARYCFPRANYPVTLHDCSSGPPSSAASAAEASLPVPRSTRASLLSGLSPVPRAGLLPTFVEVCRV